MKYVVYDSETTIANRGEFAIGTSQGSPFHPDNFVVAHGELALNNGREVKQLSYDVERRIAPPWWLTYKDHVLVIGHNTGFDLQHAWAMWPDLFWSKLPTLHIWDTQQAAYLLSGHDKLFNSLNQLSEELGLPPKLDRVKLEYWDQGIDTVFVPKDLLLEYLGAADLHNPLAIFRHQWAELEKNPKLMALAKIKMDDILMTTIMTINGMKFDIMLANDKVEELDGQIEELRTRIMESVHGMFVDSFSFDPDSPTHISLVVFGGSYKVVEDVQQEDEAGNALRYKGGQKAGQIKTRKEKVEQTTTGFGLKPGNAPKLKNGLYSSESDYLAQHIEHPFIKDVLRYRELQKDVTTYYRGYSKFVWPDGLIHQQINQAATDTGRQSSSQPNLQNVTKEDE